MTLGAFVENADRRQGAQQTRERRRVSFRCASEKFDVSPSVGDAIREAQVGGGMNKTCRERAIEQAHHRFGRFWIGMIG